MRTGPGYGELHYSEYELGTQCQAVLDLSYFLNEQKHFHSSTSNPTKISIRIICRQYSDFLFQIVLSRNVYDQFRNGLRLFIFRVLQIQQFYLNTILGVVKILNNHWEYLKRKAFNTLKASIASAIQIFSACGDSFCIKNCVIGLVEPFLACF